MADLFIFDFGRAGEDERARRAAEHARVRARYVVRVVNEVGLDNATAELVVAAIFDHTASDGRECPCSCHPQLYAHHDGGMDCPCTWDERRRESERQRTTRWWDSPAFEELRAHHAAEGSAIEEWLAGQAGVAARRTSSYAPEQWEGTVDGHTFYFRERHGEWRIELDLEPNGRFANRFTGVADDGSPITEPVELTEGEVIARGVDAELGEGPTNRLAFIVRTVRDELRRRQCDHRGALFFCPSCGIRLASRT